MNEREFPILQMRQYHTGRLAVLLGGREYSEPKYRIYEDNDIDSTDAIHLWPDAFGYYRRAGVKVVDAITGELILAYQTTNRIDVVT